MNLFIIRKITNSFNPYRYPILFVQEGGYKNRTLGINARNFFEGFLSTRVK